jgi:hypothetical protein
MIWPQVAASDWSGKSSSGNLGIELTPSQDGVAHRTNTTELHNSNKQAIKIQATCPRVSECVEYEAADHLESIGLGGATNLYIPPGPSGGQLETHFLYYPWGDLRVSSLLLTCLVKTAHRG